MKNTENLSAHNISSGQFFSAMFVSRIVITIALNSQYLGGENMLDNIISYLISMALGFVIAAPILALNARRPMLDMNQAAEGSLGGLGKLVPIAYILYFVLVNAVSLSMFQIFLLNTVNPDFSAALVMLALVAVALYGAVRGIETVARCAVCVLVVMLLSCALVFIAVAGRFDLDNMEPLFYNGFSQTAQGTALFIARTSVFADMAILFPQVRGRKGVGFTCWAAGTAAFVSLLILLIVGCLGRYAYTQNYPVYSLASLTEIGSMQRLDAIFIGVWMSGLVIKLACDIYACRVCFSDLTNRRQGKVFAIFAAAAVAVLCIFISQTAELQHYLLDTRLLLICTVITGFCIPLVVLIADAIKSSFKKGAGK